jgi:hypothetical protein
MTKEQVLQKANDYCTEKSYTETLTDEFKDKFSDFFSKKYPETDAEDETMIADLKFNLDTAFSATSKGITSKQKAFEDKENEYKNQIAELTKKLEKKPKTTDTKIPQELQEKLDKLEKFENEQRKREKYAAVLALAKKGVREDLHSSFEKYAADFAVNLEETESEQAKRLTSKFQEIFRDSIGDIKPLAPKQVMKNDMEYIESVPKIKVC